MFVSKYNTSGEKQWTRLLGASGTNTYAYGSSTDSAGTCDMFITTNINNNPGPAAYF